MTLEITTNYNVTGVHHVAHEMELAVTLTAVEKTAALCSQVHQKLITAETVI